MPTNSGTVGKYVLVLYRQALCGTAFVTDVALEWVINAAVRAS